jgi:hypothetical protein
MQAVSDMTTFFRGRDDTALKCSQPAQRFLGERLFGKFANLDG